MVHDSGERRSQSHLSGIAAFLRPRCPVLFTSHDTLGQIQYWNVFVLSHIDVFTLSSPVNLGVIYMFLRYPSCVLCDISGQRGFDRGFLFVPDDR